MTVLGRPVIVGIPAPASPSDNRTTFTATAVRRRRDGASRSSWLRLSRTVVDLIAETEGSVELDVCYRLDGVTGTLHLDWTVRGHDRATTEFAGELRGLLTPYYRLAEIGSAPALPVRRRLHVVPAVHLADSRGLGFGQSLAASPRDVIAQATDAGPEELLAAIAAAPALRFRVSVCVNPAPDAALTYTSRLITERPDVAGDIFATVRNIGRPVYGAAVLEVMATLPCRSGHAPRCGPGSTACA